MNKKEQLRWLGILGGTIAGLFILFSVYYFVYVSSQKAYITNRNFRRLALLSNQMKSQIENYGKNVLKNTFEVDVADIDLVRKEQIANYEKSAEVEPVPVNRELCSPNDKECVRNVVRRRIALIKELSLIGDVDFSTPEKKSGIKINLNGERITFNYDGPIIFKKRPPADLLADIYIKFSLERDFEDLIGPNGRKWFQGVFIADKSGEIKAYQLDDEISVNRLKTALKDGKAVEFESLINVSDVFDISVSGNNFKLFVYPIQVQLNEATAEKWIVCALIPAAEFHTESLSISYTVLIVFLLCFLTASLSMPYLKILLMGSRDKLQRGDVRFLAISTFIGSAILTLFICDLIFYKNLEKKFDDQLESFSKSIQSNFNAELGKMCLQLESLSKLPKLPELPCSEEPNERETCSKESEVNILDSGLDAKDYKYFEMAFWIDRSGMQRVKWTIRESTTAFIPVDNREYFRNVVDGQLIRKSFDNNGNYDLSLVPIYSKNTGENLVVLSMAHTSNPSKNKELPNVSWVAALDVKLLSLLEPVVPVSYGYAVVNNEGLVLFHSSSDRNLRENFVKESENNKQLRAALFAHTKDWINSQYTGKGHRLFVAPMEDFPWSLVVFRNKELLRTSNADLLSISFFVFLLYSAILFACGGIVKLSLPDFFRDFLWPDENRIRHYILLLIAYFLLFLIFSIAIQIFNPTTLSLWILFWPLFFFSITVLIFRLKQPSNEVTALPDKFVPKNLAARRKGILFRGSYLAVLTFVSILTGILPAIAIFKIGHDYEMMLFVRYGQLNLVRSMSDRLERIKDEYRDVHLPEEFIKTRLEQSFDRYYDHILGGIDKERDPKSVDKSTEPGWQWEFLSRVRPLYNRNAIETDRLWKDSSVDGSFMLEGKDYLDRKIDGAIIKSELPKFELPYFWFWWVCVISLLFIVFQLLRFAARRIFLLGVRLPSIPQATELVPKEPTKNLLILGPPYSGKTDLLIIKEFEPIDIRKLSIEKDWVKEYLAQVFSNRKNKAIAIDHLEYNLEDLKANRKKCELLEELLNTGTKTVVASAIDPRSFHFGPIPGEKEDARINAVYSARWANIFSTFSNVLVSDCGDQVGFVESISTTGKDLEKELTDCLKDECKPTAYLQKVGKEMLTLNLISYLDKHQLIAEVFDRAYSYYQTIWNACSDIEKQTLYDLAEDGLANPRSPALGSLMRKGLILREPNVKIMNQSFRRFVLLTGARESVVIQQEGETSTWGMLKVPFSVVLITVAAFLFISQRELFQSTTALIASLSASVPAVLNILGAFRLGRSKSTAE